MTRPNSSPKSNVPKKATTAALALRKWLRAERGRARVLAAACGISQQVLWSRYAGGRWNRPRSATLRAQIERVTEGFVLACNWTTADDCPAWTENDFELLILCFEALRARVDPQVRVALAPMWLRLQCGLRACGLPVDVPLVEPETTSPVEVAPGSAAPSGATDASPTDLMGTPQKLH